MSFAHPEYLVEAAWLNEHLDDPTVCVLEATVYLRREDGRMARVSGRPDFERDHIPGARFADLIEDLSDPGSRLGFTMPSAERFAQGVARLGVSNDHRVICYDRGAGMWATRLWWMFRAVGHETVAVLNGGYHAWQTGGFPVTSEQPAIATATFAARMRPSFFADKTEVLAAIGDGAVCTINALAPEVFRGESGAYRRRGRIPGSVNLPAGEVFDPESGLIRSEADLRAAFAAVGATSRERVITYCGGGIAATADAFALTLLGHQNIAVYDGSLTEWMADESLPVEVG